MLELQYDTKEEIPAGYEALYSEKGGKWVLTEVKGMKTEADVTRLNSALVKERNDHKQAKDALRNLESSFDGLTIDQVKDKLDSIPTLEAAAAGKLDNTKIEELVNQRLNVKVAPLQRQLAEKDNELKQSKVELENFKKKDTNRKIVDAVRSAARETKIRDSALSDLELNAERDFEVDKDTGEIRVRDGVAITAGLSVTEWLKERQQKNPHWWPESNGGGANGNRGKVIGLEGGNPWSHEHWNLTKQGEIIRKDRALATRAAAQAGVSMVGGKRPSAPDKK